MFSMVSLDEKVSQRAVERKLQVGPKDIGSKSMRESESDPNVMLFDLEHLTHETRPSQVEGARFPVAQRCPLPHETGAFTSIAYAEDFSFIGTILFTFDDTSEKLQSSVCTQA